MFTVTPSRVQLANCTKILEKAFTSPLICTVVHVLASFTCNLKMVLDDASYWLFKEWGLEGEEGGEEETISYTIGV
jgi:hypothetical protein